MCIHAGISSQCSCSGTSRPLYVTRSCLGFGEGALPQHEAHQTNGEEERWSAAEESVTIVEPRDYQCLDERMTGIRGKREPNLSKMPDVVE